MKKKKTNPPVILINFKAMLLIIFLILKHIYMHKKRFHFADN